MRPEQLKDKLFHITESENRYRNGMKDPKVASFPWINVNGKNVMSFSYAVISLEHEAAPFLVRKHSRFRDYPEHIHDWIEISYMYSGNCVQVINGVSYPMKTGQLLLMAPDTIHTIEPLGENDILIQISLGREHLNANFYNRFSTAGLVSQFFMNAFQKTSNHNNFYIFNTENSDRLRVFIEEFLCEFYEPSQSSLDIQNDLFSLILSDLLNSVDVTSEANKKKHNNDYILPILHYIELNYKTCQLQDVANHFGLNANYLSNLLKKHTGSSFNKLVTQQKLSSAERLLKSTSMSIIEIANFIGYQNISYFYQIFAARNGCLPGEYRQQHQQTDNQKESIV